MENLNPYTPQKVRILEVFPQTALDFTFKIESGIKPGPGRFVQVSLPWIGEAPISVSDYGTDYIELTIRRIGNLTREICRLRPGDFLYLRGPYGKGFPLENYFGKHLIIAAGGSGLAPVKSIINYFYRQPGQVKRMDLIMGFKTPADILFREEIAKWKESFHIVLTVDTADPSWTGKTGLITGHLSGVPIDHSGMPEVVIVGPPAMMKFTALEFLKRGILKEKIWVSFERRMSCGIGKCGHCKIDDTYVCLDGPVFNYTKAETLID